MADTVTAELTTEQRTLIHYEVKEGVAYLTLDDPPANTYTHEMMRQIDESIVKARFDREVHVIVLAGKGRPSWSSRRSKGIRSAAASRSPWRRTS